MDIHRWGEDGVGQDVAGGHRCAKREGINIGKRDQRSPEVSGAIHELAADAVDDHGLGDDEAGSKELAAIYRGAATAWGWIGVWSSCVEE